MHCDYQLAYCPLTYIAALAFRDNAFENERLTPEIFWQLRVPKRLHVLPIRWKKSMLKVPLLRQTEQTPYGIDVHPTMPMKYDSSNSALKNIGDGAGYENPLDHYNFRRRTANEANRK